LPEIFKQNPVAGVTAVIGKRTIIKGTIYSRQDVFLDGEIEGDLDVETCTLTIGPNGRAIANARAREVDIQGALKGNVESTHMVSIRTGGRLVGDIRTPGIVIEDGAYFKGAVDIVQPPADGEPGSDA
jgi:cytoskeletal protein CcmA (bactofilin family)